MPGPPRLSVVIPTLDEESHVEAAIRSVRDEAEVLVVDGGSRDRTRELARGLGAQVVAAPACRGAQLDAGARRASGDWIVFLHADTWLEPGWAAALRGIGAPFVGGAFRFALASPRPRYRLVEAGVALRCRALKLPYGDQGQFARREAYQAVGGFAPLPLMEDVEFVRRLAGAGPLALLAPRAFTSPRRWERDGLLRTTLRNWRLLALYAAGRPRRRRGDAGRHGLPSGDAA